MIHQAPLEAGAAWAYSSVVEHCVDIAGVASSILATPTIFSFAMSFSEISYKLLLILIYIYALFLLQNFESTVSKACLKRIKHSKSQWNHNGL